MRVPRGLPPYLGVSLVLHAALFFVYVRSVSGARFAVPHPGAYRVSLVQLPGGSGPAPGEGPGPAAKAPEPEKKDEKTVRIPEKPRPMKKTEPSKNEPKKTDVKKKDTTRTRERPPEEGTSSGSGGEGGSGAGTGIGTGTGSGFGSGSGIVGLDGADFPFLYYLALIEARIGDRWVPPEGLVSGGKPPSATVRFDIHRDGRVHGPKVSESSGISYFDLSAIRAVLESDPFPPLPDGFPGDRLGVFFVFRFER
ncbi:MAG: TonB C-terminal domain-containing protein [Candidatus Eisenbacteria bacterium]|nr:TonB C-terminal domain-containing protein [Candidatus Eisenbacteria bacterium]